MAKAAEITLCVLQIAIPLSSTDPTVHPTDLLLIPNHVNQN